LRYHSILLAVLLGAILLAPASLRAQQQNAPAAETSATGDAAAPPHRTSLRFLTSTDFPPFNYADEEGQLTGFNIDFARSVCVELEVSCDIKAVPFGELLSTLDHGDGDAAIGAIAVTPSTISRAEFSRRYYFMTGHFAVRRAGVKPDITPAGLESRKIAVQARSSHEAYLKAFFPDSQIVSLPTADAAREALAKGNVDALFADGLALAFWTNGTSSKGCCELSGKAFNDARYFGDGMAIALRKGDAPLTRQVDAAITRILASNRYEELLARYFPVRLF
jgi:polar amino acid transport system substrate-binding protein